MLTTSNRNLQDTPQVQNTENQPPSKNTRWDKVQGEFENKRTRGKAKKHHEAMKIMRTRSNAQLSQNSEDKELQEEALEFIGVEIKIPRRW